VLLALVVTAIHAGYFYASGLCRWVEPEELLSCDLCMCPFVYQFVRDVVSTICATCIDDFFTELLPVVQT